MKEKASMSSVVLIFSVNSFQYIHLISLNHGAKAKTSQALNPGSNICIVFIFMFLLLFVQKFNSTVGRTTGFLSVSLNTGLYSFFSTLFMQLCKLFFYSKYMCSFSIEVLLYSIGKLFERKICKSVLEFCLLFRKLPVAQKLSVADMIASWMIHVCGWRSVT